MKNSVLCAVWYFLSIFPSQAGDVVTLKNGVRKFCQVVGGEGLDVIVSSQPIAELPPFESRYPKSQIASIEFGQYPYLETLLRQSTVTKAEELVSLWNRFVPLLGFTGSPSSRIGLRLGLLYLETTDKSLLQAALDIFSQIAEGGTDLSDRESAQQGRLRVWIALGRGSDAVLEALKILTRPGGSNLWAEANITLADAKARELAQLLEDNPRWEEDEAAGTERTRLYHESLDFYLLAALLPEVAPGLAARGLWGALAIYVKCDETSRAADTARDLSTLFPGTPFGAKAADFLSTLPTEIQNNTEDRQKQPTAHPIQDAVNDHLLYEPQNPSVSSETTLDTSGAPPKRRKRDRNRNQ